MAQVSSGLEQAILNLAGEPPPGDWPRRPLAGRAWLRREAGALVVDSFFKGASSAGRFVPLTQPSLHGVEVRRDLPYRDTGLREHLLDVYRPRRARGKLPVVLYVHGGGFRILSKESHWLFGLLFARRGYLVFNINYRLAPKHPFPAAIEDASHAYRWVVENAERFGGDPERLVLAGESAGGNLVTSLTIASCYERPEPFAREVFATGLTPRATLPACAILQVTEPDRFGKPRPLPLVIQDRIDEVCDAYLCGLVPKSRRELDLADPLLVFERGERPARPLPPFFAGCGTADMLVADTRRLKAALDQLGAVCEARYYERELHAFHAFIFLANARRYWRDAFDFLERHLPAALQTG